MSDWSEIKRLAESVPDNYSNETAQYVIFSDAADPQAILALIAENERLKNGVSLDMAEIDRMQGVIDERYRKYMALKRERDQLRAEVEALRKDKARLDWFDSLNVALNQHYGTSYHWNVVVNHNVNRLYLNSLQIVDMNDQDCHGLTSCRDAIDAAMSKDKDHG